MSSSPSMPPPTARRPRAMSSPRRRPMPAARSTSTAATTTSPSAPPGARAEHLHHRDLVPARRHGRATSTGTGGLTTAIPLVTKGRGEGDQSNVDANWFLGIDTKGTTTTADDTLAADFEDFETPAGTNNNHPVIGVTPSRSAPPGTTPRRPMTPPPTPGTCTSTATSTDPRRWAATTRRAATASSTPAWARR